MIIEPKDILKRQDLGDGFVIIQTGSKYYMSIYCKEGIDAIQEIDHEAYNSLERREGWKQ